MKRWITFDLDGTLMQNPFMKWVFPEIESVILAQSKEKYKVIDALVAEHETRMSAKQIVAAYDWDDILQKHLAEKEFNFQLNVEELVLKHAVEPKIYLLENEVLTVLQELKNRGYHLAAVTNGFLKYQFPVMEKLGLAQMFDQIITPEQVGYGKPDVGILEGLAQEGKIIAHVGDRIDHDVCLANAFGTMSIYYSQKLSVELRGLTPRDRVDHPSLQELWETHQATPNLVVYSITELLDYLE